MVTKLSVTNIAGASQFGGGCADCQSRKVIMKGGALMPPFIIRI